MNKIAVVSMVKNEEDIIESFIRHCSTFADEIFVCDHKSTDKTAEILNLLRAEGIPLVIFYFDSDEKAQADVTNQLIDRALESGADIILPLDADEFPIEIDGNPVTLRRFFQTADSKKCYRTFLRNYLFDDDEVEKFALSRAMSRYKSLTHKKVIIGRKKYLQDGLKISQGNHELILSNGEQLEDIEPLNKIFYAHFAERSEAQAASKYITNFLNTVLKDTHYTSLGYHNRLAVEKFFAGEKLIDRTGFSLTHLSAYQDEAENRYTSKNQNALRNISRLASNFVTTIINERILAQHEIVRVFILDDGDQSRFERSLESVQNQTYPFIEIFRANVDEDFLQVSGCDYIQFVISGDVLKPEKIFHCVELMHSSNNPKIAFTGLDFSTASKDNLPAEIKLDYNNFGVTLQIAGIEILSLLLENKATIISGISRGFFKREVFEENHVQTWIQSLRLTRNFDSTTIVFLLETFFHTKVFFMDEKLVIRGSVDWQLNDLDFHRNICQTILEGISQ